jgi:hypothetical protein
VADRDSGRDPRLAISPYVWPYSLFFGLLGPTPQSGKNTPKMA